MPDLAPGQEQALDRISEWLKTMPKPTYCSDPACLGLPDEGEEAPHTHGHAGSSEPLSLGGLAGTGKTLLTGQLAERLGVRASFGTPTNKAAAVLRGKLPESQRGRCATYHSLLYRPHSWHTCLASGASARELQCACGRGFEHDECRCPRFQCDTCTDRSAGCKVEEHLEFEPRAFAGGYRDLIVIDEASMVTEEQVDDIRRFGLPVLLVGDHGQLPPVKGSLSRWMKSPDIVLEENFRQQEKSGIVQAALTARNVGTLPLGRYGDSVLVANGSSRPDLYNALLPPRLIPGPDSAVITWTNRSRADVNQRVHKAHALLAGKNPDLAVTEGDRLVSLGTYECDVVKPDGSGWRAAGWQHRAFNGQAGTVLSVPKITSRYADVIIAVEDPSRPLAAPEECVKILRRIDVAQLSADRKLRPDERVAAAFDYGYCLTAHKAQGSEYSKVAVLGQGPSGPDRARWMYTACTRAREKLLVIILVLFVSFLVRC